MIEILDKMIQIADWYFDNYCSDINKARQIFENNLLCYRMYFDNYCSDINKARQIYENNLLCYRIKNSNTINEPTSRNTVLSLLGGVWTFFELFNIQREELLDLLR